MRCWSWPRNLDWVERKSEMPNDAVGATGLAEEFENELDHTDRHNQADTNAGLTRCSGYRKLNLKFLGVPSSRRNTSAGRGGSLAGFPGLPLS